MSAGLLETYPQTLWRQHSDAVHGALLERWLPSGLDSVLKTDLFDEAAGEGLYPLLARRAGLVHGIDESPSIVRAASRRYPALRAVAADVRKLPYADGEIGAVVSNSTLDHLESQAAIVAALCELRRVLRPGGTLVLTLDNPRNPIVGLTKIVPRRLLNRVWTRAGAASARVGMLPYTVGATVGPGRLPDLLDGLGYDVGETTFIVHAPRVAAVVAANAVERRASVRGRERFLRALARCERLDRLPTRTITGHLTAVRAVRR